MAAEEVDGAPTGLRVEYGAAPLGTGIVNPRLSWLLPAGTDGQLAYEVETTRGGVRATAGPVESQESVLVRVPLPERATGRVDWRVRVCTDRGWSGWSDTSWWEAGPPPSAAWTARWITRNESADERPGHRTTTWFRARFVADGPIDTARLRITALGVYEAHLDGVRLGDAELTPGYTQYEHRLQVQTLDLDGLLQAGHEHELAVEVSDGWYRGQVGLFRAADQWGGATALLAELAVGEGEGRRPLVATGEAWRWAASRHVADLIEGETFDLAAPGPQLPLRDVAVLDTGTAHLVASPAPPVRRVQHLPARAVTRIDGGQLVDFGQNLNGWVRLRRPGAAGSRLTLTHGEALAPDGTLTQANLVPDLPMLPAPLSAGQVDTVLVGADSDAVVEPRHSTKGFRYVAVEGLDHDLEAADLDAVVVQTDLRRTGTFRCSDERLNRLHDAVDWSFRSNACDIPTDCPTRERAGWTGDWQIFLPTAAFLADVAGFSTKWLLDLVAAQWPDGTVPDFAPEPRFEGREGPVAFMRGSAGWNDAVVLVPWTQHLVYGDTAVLRLAWPAIERWLDRAVTAARTGRHPTRVAARPKPAPHEEHLWDTGFHFGEWLEPVPEVSGEFGAFLAADKAAVATAYLRHSTSLAADIARTLGMTAEATRWAEYSERVRAAWTAEFLDADGLVRPATQADCVRALAFGLVPNDARPAIATQLVGLIRAADTHLRTGFLATPLLLPVLADAGHAEVAYDLLFQDTWPSWLSMLDQGATTVWERWEGYDEHGMPAHSHNHYSKGAVVEFLHRRVAGIVPTAPGYRRFTVAPVVDNRLDWAEATFDSPYGRIRSRWERDGRAGMRFEVTVPPGAECAVRLPDGAEHSIRAGRHWFSARVGDARHTRDA